MTNKLDQFYRSLVLSKYFVQGWGKPENLKRLCEFRKIISNRETCFPLVPRDYSVVIEKEHEKKDYVLIDGYFVTPLSLYLPEVVPESCRKAHFQFILPKRWNDENFKPVILQMAGTGDQYFWRRRHLVAKPLLREAGIGSILLENPFYGLRKPMEQRRSILRNVSDVFVMGGCLILESLVLFHYCERIGLGPLGVTGLSMGGHMASLAATSWPKPLVVVPCLSGLTASLSFTQGAISHALNWQLLSQQYTTESGLKDEVQKMVKIIEGDAFKAGQQFAKNFSTDNESVDIPLLNSIKVDESLAATVTEAKSCHRKAALPNLSLVSEACDNLPFMSTNTTPKNSNYVTDGDSASIQSTYKSLATEGVNANSEATVNSLLNVIVKLARASVNLNILSNEKGSELKKNDISASEQEALYFMTGIMDEMTHLKNYSVPVDTSLTITVRADNDAYVPIRNRSHLGQVWPGAETRYVSGGHIRAYVQYQKEFRTAIVEAFQRYREKYIDKEMKSDAPNT